MNFGSCLNIAYTVSLYGDNDPILQSPPELSRFSTGNPCFSKPALATVSGMGASS